MSAQKEPSAPDENIIPRRKFIGAGSSALIMSALALSRVKGQDIDSVAKAQSGESASNPGPENTTIQAAAPDAFLPPPTDHGNAPEFWNSFSEAHRQIQPGGW